LFAASRCVGYNSGKESPEDKRSTMNELPELHVIFTMGCDPIPRKAAAGDAPRNWEVSSRAIEGYTYRLARAGFPVTLFLDPWCVEEHTPLLEELMVQKAEYGAYVHPPNLLLSRFTRHLGEYNAADQRTMIEHVTDRFYEALGIRPRSFRGGRFSASDATFKVLYELGYRQGSLSRPGFDAPSTPHSGMARSCTPTMRTPTIG